MTTLAWHNNPTLKTEVMQRLRAHRAEDSIVKGLYQRIDPALASGYRGCAIGCTLPAQVAFGEVAGLDPDAPDAGWHGEVERLYGIPRAIALLIDGIFENLPTDADQHAEFAVAVVDAVPVGADLSLIVARFLLDLLNAAYNDAYDAAYDASDASARQLNRVWQAERLIHHLATAPIGVPA